MDLYVKYNIIDIYVQGGPELYVLLHTLDETPLYGHHSLLLPFLHELENLHQDEADLPLHGQVPLLLHEESQQPGGCSHCYR